jgi:hypothetical protein
MRSTSPKKKEAEYGRCQTGLSEATLNVNGLLLGSACVQYWTKALLDGLSRITT